MDLEYSVNLKEKTLAIGHQFANSPMLSPANVFAIWYHEHVCLSLTFLSNLFDIQLDPLIAIMSLILSCLQIKYTPATIVPLFKSKIIHVYLFHDILFSLFSISMKYLNTNYFSVRRLMLEEVYL